MTHIPRGKHHRRYPVKLDKLYSGKGSPTQRNENESDDEDFSQ
jgi:hypothetical protein